MLASRRDKCQAGQLILVVLNGFGHYQVYGGEAFRQVMDETLAWYRTHIPAR